MRVGRFRLPEPAVRLIAGGAIVGFTLVILWQTGLILSSDKGGTLVEPQQPASLRAADASIETPNALGAQVGLRPGNLAPDFEFSDFQGRRMRLSSFRGQPVAVNFWASWCGPCKAEMPDLEAAIQRYQSHGLTIIGVNNGETFATGKRFIDRIGVKLTAFAYDPGQAVARRYSVLGMPTTYFLDAEGVITGVITGALTRTLLDSSIQDAIIGWGRVQAR